MQCKVKRNAPQKYNKKQSLLVKKSKKISRAKEKYFLIEKERMKLFSRAFHFHYQ